MPAPPIPMKWNRLSTKGVSSTASNLALEPYPAGCDHHSKTAHLRALGRGAAPCERSRRCLRSRTTSPRTRPRRAGSSRRRPIRAPASAARRRRPDPDRQPRHLAHRRHAQPPLDPLQRRRRHELRLPRSPPTPHVPLTPPDVGRTIKVRVRGDADQPARLQGGGFGAHRRGRRRTDRSPTRATPAGPSSGRRSRAPPPASATPPRRSREDQYQWERCAAPDFTTCTADRRSHLPEAHPHRDRPRQPASNPGAGDLRPRQQRRSTPTRPTAAR